MAAQAGLTVTPLRTLPMFGPEMAIAEELTAAVEREGEQLRDGDVLVLAQKIVSKCEGRIVRLSDVHAAVDDDTHVRFRLELLREIGEQLGLATRHDEEVRAHHERF